MLWFGFNYLTVLNKFIANLYPLGVYLSYRSTTNSAHTKITFSRNVAKNQLWNLLRNVNKNVSKIFLSMLCFGEKRHRIGNTEGYVYIWNCSLIVQKAYSSSTQLTRLKIQINTQITNHQKSHHQISHSKKYHKIIRYCSSTNSPIHPISSSIKTISKIPYIKTQKSISITHSQTNYNALYAHFHA